MSDPFNIIIPASSTPTTLTISVIVSPATPPVGNPSTNPPPVTVPPVAKMAIGTNVPANDATTGVAAWCDVTRACTGWYSVGGQITYDANGYPATVTPGGQSAAWTYLYGYPPGTYKLAWKGPQNGLGIQGKNLAPVSDGAGGWTATVQFNTGDRVEFRSPGGISAVSLLAPDAKPGQTFRDAYLALLKPYKVVRLMCMQRVNGVGLPPTLRTNWATRVTPSQWDQTSNEVAIEHCAQLCRESGTIPWVCIPYGAPDDYITGLAKAFTGFPMVYVEYSNEAWNTGPAYQGNIVRSDGQKIYPGDPNVAGAKYHADLTKHAGDIFRNTLGQAKVKVVFGAQATWDAWSKNATSNLKPGDVDCLAIAPYFQTTGTDPQSTVPQILASCQKWIDSILSPGMTANAKVAKTYGAELIGYESGQSLVPSMANAPNVALQPDSPAQAAAFAADPMTAAQFDPGMGQLYDSMFAACRAVGMTLNCHFMIVSNWGRSGYWGLRQQTTDPENVKTQAVSRAIAAS